MGQRPGEANAALRQAVDHGGAGPGALVDRELRPPVVLLLVAGQGVGPGRVEADEHDGAAGLRGGLIRRGRLT